MFKITQNTINAFTLAEILLMAAMNEIVAKRKTEADCGHRILDQGTKPLPLTVSTTETVSAEIGLVESAPI
jgi:hypothetical protein